MSDYSAIDDTIRDCLKGKGETLITEWAGEPARFFYIPGTPPFECFQISIGVPLAGRVSVFAASVDTNDHSELEQTWHGPIAELEAMLSAALAVVETWKERPQSGCR